MVSSSYKYWKSALDFKTCFNCRCMHGKIYSISEQIEPKPPLHPFCRCEIDFLQALLAGTATLKSNDGADWWLKNNKHLPSYYISKQDARNLGWKPQLGNLSQVAPEKMIFKGLYRNSNGHLPVKTGRIWYEADINYTDGFRGTGRILFSNDGLIFVTYDHYMTFCEIV